MEYEDYCVGNPLNYPCLTCHSPAGSSCSFAVEKPVTNHTQFFHDSRVQIAAIQNLIAQQKQDNLQTEWVENLLPLASLLPTNVQLRRLIYHFEFVIDSVEYTEKLPHVGELHFAPYTKLDGVTGSTPLAIDRLATLFD